MPKPATKKVQPPTLQPQKISPLKRHRLLAGLMQRDVAAAVDRPPNWLCEVERGKVNVFVHDAVRLAQVLRVPVEDLFPVQGGRR